MWLSIRGGTGPWQLRAEYLGSRLGPALLPCVSLGTIDLGGLMRIYAPALAMAMGRLASPYPALAMAILLSARSIVGASALGIWPMIARGGHMLSGLYWAQPRYKAIVAVLTVTVVMITVVRRMVQNCRFPFWLVWRTCLLYRLVVSVAGGLGVPNTGGTRGTATCAFA